MDPIDLARLRAENAWRRQLVDAGVRACDTIDLLLMEVERLRAENEKLREK